MTTINSNAHFKQKNRDVRCINIILRSECGKHSKQCGCLENRVDQYKNTTITRINEDLIQRNSIVSSIETPRFESTKENRYHDISNIVSAKHQFTLPEPTKAEFKRIEINQECDPAVASNRSNLGALRIQEPNAWPSIHCVRANNETSSTVSDYETARQLRYHKDNEMLLSEALPLTEGTENVEENPSAFISVPLPSINRSDKINRDVQFKGTKDEKNCRAKISCVEARKDIHIDKIMEAGGKLFPRTVVVPEVNTNTDIFKRNLEETNGNSKDRTIIPKMHLKTDFRGINVGDRNLAHTRSMDLKSELDDTNARKYNSMSIISKPDVHSTLINVEPKPTVTNDSKLTNYKSMPPEFCSCSMLHRIPCNKNLLVIDHKMNNSRCYIRQRKNHLEHDLLLNSKNVASKKVTLKDQKLKGNKADETYCVNADYDVVDPSVLNAEKCLTECKHKDGNTKHSSNCKTGKNLESQNDTYRDTSKNKKSTANKKVSVRSTSLSDSTLEVLERMLEGAEKFKNKQEITNKVKVPEAEKKVRSKSQDRNEFNNDSLIPSDFTKPEFLKMLIEIKDHTKNLEEKLTMMNKSMKIKKKISEKLAPISEQNVTQIVSGKISKSLKERKDATTQQPDKRNTYIQEPNKDIDHIQELTHLPNGKNTNTQQMNFTESMLSEDTGNYIVKQINLNLQNKRQKQYVENDTTILINNSSGKSGGNIEEQSNDEHGYPFTVCANNDKWLKCCTAPAKVQINRSEAFYPSNSDNGKTQTDSEFPSVSQHSRYFPSEKHSEQIDRYADSILTFTPDDSDVRQQPLVTPTLKKNSSRKKEENCDISCCFKSNSFFNKNSTKDQIAKTILTELVQYPMKQQTNTINSTRIINYLDGKESSIFHERSKTDDVEIPLTRGISSTPLKSKHKRLEFRHFRPKCIIHSFLLCDYKLIKYWPRKQNMSVSSRMYKRVRSITRKIEESRSEPLSLNADVNTRNAISSLFLQKANDPALSNFLVTACTQSSDFQITAATSVSSMTLKENFNVTSEEFNQEGIAKKETCVVS